MSEAELHLLKQRLYQGTLQKARRGALSFALPIGYVHNASGEVVYDPDEQVQHVVRLIFRQFDELGTLHALLRYLVQHDIQREQGDAGGNRESPVEWLVLFTCHSNPEKPPYACQIATRHLSR